MYADVIDPVIKVLRQTLKLAADFDSTEKQRNTLRTVLRKLLVIKTLHSTSLISITGTQGAGKTRLLREIYGLDAWLDDNAGRGEKRPLFVIESDCNKPWAAGVNSEGVEEPIDRETLTRELRSFSENERFLLLRLYVPRKHFEEGFGFLLLPGYERMTPNNQLWQREMRDTLKHSMGCILVTDQTRMADQATVTILDDLMKQCFENRAPIIAISRTENQTDDERKALCATVAEGCGVDAAELDRVVCCGVGDTWREQWMPKLLNAIKKYSRPSREVNRQRLDDLASVVDVELEEAFALLDTLISDVDSRGRAQTLLLNDIMERFRKSSEDYRRRYERQLRERSSSYAYLASKAAQQEYVGEEQGLWNKLGNFFTGDDGRFVQRIERHWQVQEDRTPLEVTYLALSDLAGRKLNLGYEQSGVPQDQELNRISKQGMQALLGYEREGATVQLFGQSMDAQQLQTGLRLLLQRSDKKDQEVYLSRQRVESREITHALELLPTLSMEYLRVAHAAVFAAEPGRLPGRSIESIDPEAVADQIKVGLPKLKETTQQLMKAVLSIAAVDLAIDGSLDLPTILTGGAAGLGATLSGAAAGVITLAFVGYKVNQAMQQYDAEQKNFIALCMDHLASHQVEKALQHYDDVIEELEERLVYNLSRAYGIDSEMFSERDAMARAIYSLRNARRDLTVGIERVQQHYLA